MNGRTEGWTVRLSFASQSSFGGIKTVLLKNDLMIATNQVYKYSTSLYIESPYDGRCFIVIWHKNEC